MVIAKFDIEEDGKSLLLEVKGHAGQNEVGKDIVCSAASILTYTVAQIVTDMYEGMKLVCKPTVKMESGNAVIKFKPKDEFEQYAFQALHFACTGFELLAGEYPEYVTIKTVVNGE